MSSYNGQVAYDIHAGSRICMTKGDNNQKISAMGFRVALYVK